ncbi:MAG: efflux RND transporter periplasmic adaptor subunit [Alphaproteobacteria bacterium]|nr:efflux RND transporter periplasmic adaptor subunit [Alphaproteobacteria bacterium]MCB9792090.1 efflux RND transporter periplasmic adaptor subunit [Alphaproteobacteria bacterium]
MNTPRALRVFAQALALLLAFAIGVWSTDEATPPHEHAAEVTVWTCSMHPQVRQGEPGQCPLCGMDLIPATGADEGAPESITLSPRAQVLAELRTEEVRRADGEGATLRLLGRVEAAETSRRAVIAWFGGRVDRLDVQVTGERVRAGQSIAQLYSPEVYAAHQDLITAARQVSAAAGASEATQSSALAALRSARQRLNLLGVPEAELDAMAAATEPTRGVPVRSPYAGVVLERLVTEGQTVTAGQPLLQVADLREVWVQLDAYESDLPRLALGQPVSLSLEALPGETLEGRIHFIEPQVDPVRRTAAVRVELPNPQGRLLPGMFAEATVQADLGDRPLLIPATAPLFTGRRSLVYVAEQTEDGERYTPRVVHLGPRAGERYPVLAGLSEGERVVSRGAFVLDADLQLRGGPSMMSGAHDHDGEAQLIELTENQRATLEPTMRAYLAVQRALAEDDLPAAQAAAETLVDASAAVALPAKAEVTWAELSQALRTPARRLAQASDIEQARVHFQPLSFAAERLLHQLGNPLDAPVRVAFCPMALGPDGARWLQQGEVVDNAYFGDRMRTCGELQEPVAPGGYLSTLGSAPKGSAP